MMLIVKDRAPGVIDPGTLYSETTTDLPDDAGFLVDSTEPSIEQT
jgi:hypothetical protein